MQFRKSLAVAAMGLLVGTAATRPVLANTYMMSCNDSVHDVQNINNAIRIAAQASGSTVQHINSTIGSNVQAEGSTVQLSSGTCNVGDSPIELQSNVSLTGAEPRQGTTLLRQSGFTNGPIIQANNANPTGGLRNIRIANMTIDGRNFVTRKASISRRVRANSTTLTFKALPAGVARNMPVRNSTDPRSIPNDDTVLSVHGNTVTLRSATHSTISQGDEIVFYTTSVTIDAEWIDGLSISNLRMIHTSGLTSMTIQGVQNFVVSNNFVSVANPDPEATGTLLLTARTANTAPAGHWNHDGFIFNNTLTNASIEIGGTSIVISGNSIVPGYGSGVVSGGIDPHTHDPTSDHNVFERNAIFGSRPGLNHDGIVAGGLEIWDTNSLIADNLTYDNGAQGILSGGPNNIISNNIAFDNNRSTLIQRGTSGICVQSGTSIAYNTLITKNVSCNTDGTYRTNGRASCLTRNSGSQAYALYVDPSIPSDRTIVGTDNYFRPGYTGVSISGSYLSESNPEEGSVSASQCSLPNSAGTCTSTVTWNSSSASNVSVLVGNSTNPSAFQEMASGPSGTARAPWIGNSIYVFKLISSRGVLASTTMQPTGR